jgi:hypothetical protein
MPSTPAFPSGPKLAVALVGLSRNEAELIAAKLTKSDRIQNVTEASSPSDAISQLEKGDSNCVFISIASFSWNETCGLLRHCSMKFPVALVGTSSYFMSFPAIPSDWQRRLRRYYSLPIDLGLSEIGSQLDTIVQGCHRYFLQRWLQTNASKLAEVATTEKPDVNEIVERAKAVSSAVQATAGTPDNPELATVLGVSSETIRTVFDDTIRDARARATRAHYAHIATLAVGLAILVLSAILAAARGLDPWSVGFSATGASAAIATLIVNPRRSIEAAAARVIYVQTAYFSFLMQVRLLCVAGEESVSDRSRRLEEATERLLRQIETVVVESSQRRGRPSEAHAQPANGHA